MVPFYWLICFFMLFMNISAILGSDGTTLSDADVSFRGERIIAEDVYQKKQIVAEVLKKYFDFGIKLCHEYQEKNNVKNLVFTSLKEELKALDQAIKNIVTGFEDEVNLEHVNAIVLQPLTNFINNYVQNTQSSDDLTRVQNISSDINPFFPKMISFFQAEIRSDYLNLMESSFYTISSFKNIIDLHLNLIQEFALIYPLVQGMINQSGSQCDIVSISQNISVSTVQIIDEMKTVREENYFTTKNFERFFSKQDRYPTSMYQRLMEKYPDEKDPSGNSYVYSVSVGMPIIYSYRSGTEMKEDSNFVTIEGGFVIRDSGTSSANCSKFRDLYTKAEWEDIEEKMAQQYYPNEGPELLNLIGHHFYSYGCKTYKFFVLRDAPCEKDITGFFYTCYKNSAGSLKFNDYGFAKYFQKYDIEMHHCLEIIYY